MEQQPIPGLEPTVEERALSALIQGLRDYGVVDSQLTPRAGHEEALALLSYLTDSRLLAPEPIREISVAVELRQVSRAMPESYELFRDGREIGYLRLRHGHFKVYHISQPTNPVYSTGTIGDGSFQDQFERETELRAAAVAVLREDGVRHPSPVFEIPEYIEEDEEDFDEDFPSILEEIAERSRARREELRLQFRQDLYLTIDESLDGGYSSTELVEKLQAGGFLAQDPPLGYGGSNAGS